MGNAPTGKEFVSLVNLIVDYRQPELERLDPDNSLLKCDVRKIPGGVEYGPDFGKRFEGKPLNEALQSYYWQLCGEIGKQKVKIRNLKS